MENAINSIPPEAWPLIDILFNITIVFAALWLVWTGFIWMRRRASNLTAIRGVSPNRKATPDFMSGDARARREAIKRGESFDKELERRDREDARTEKRTARRKESLVGRIGRLITLAMALFSIATMISGTLFQVSIMGRYWEQYSASERIIGVIREHPIGVAVTVLVIGYNLYVFVSSRKWESTQS